MARAALSIDPYLAPSTSLGSRLGRVGWGIAYHLLFRFSPRPLHAWRCALLRLFGATLGPNCHVYPSARIWAPWNLRCDEAACIADSAEVYNAGPVHLGSHAIVSQGAYLCGATHAIDDPAFTRLDKPITIGSYAWICARAVVGPGVHVGEGAVLGLASLATRDLQAWTVYGGVPARELKQRKRCHGA